VTRIAISGTGLYTPPHTITNDELVQSFNAYARLFNQEHAQAIAKGDVQPILESSVDFIVKASGIKQRFVVEKDHILDPKVMRPDIGERPNDQISILAEIAVAAAKDAMTRSGKTGKDIDGVICAASNMQRAYPAMAIEIQFALGVEGFGFDMNVACSSATFGIQAAADMIRAGHARSILIVNPEICSGHLNFRDRDSHFIFGDVATAIVVEAVETTTSANAWEVLSTRLKTQFSNNIRNNFGFLNRAAPDGVGKPDKLFAQEGRKVFKEVVPMVAELIIGHLVDEGHDPKALSRLWLHQANLGMNDFIARRVLGRDPLPDEAPNILAEYANTSSAGSIISFHKHSEDLSPGALGLICSFGAGYSAGSVIVKKLS
jgi:beta-ketodecanoyl-[acyl-carrier-protein] synthase